MHLIRLIFAAMAAVFFLWAALTRVRDDLDNIVDDLKKVGHRNAAGAFFAALAFGCEVVLFYGPDL